MAVKNHKCKLNHHYHYKSWQVCQESRPDSTVVSNVDENFFYKLFKCGTGIVCIIWLNKNTNTYSIWMCHTGYVMFSLKGP